MKWVLIVCLISGVADSSKNNTYCNGRFNFCVEYPSTFTKQKESENGDGTFFISKDKTSEILAWGSLAVEGAIETLEEEFKINTDSLQITYRVQKKNWFVFSGIDRKGKIVYQKTVKKNIDYLGDKNTPVFQTLRIIYPENKNAEYKNYCSVIAKSLQ